MVSRYLEPLKAEPRAMFGGVQSYLLSFGGPGCLGSSHPRGFGFCDVELDSG